MQYIITIIKVKYTCSTYLRDVSVDVNQFFTVSGLFLAPVLLEPATYFLLAGILLKAGVCLKAVVFSLHSVTAGMDTLLSTYERRFSVSHTQIKVNFNILPL